MKIRVSNITCHNSNEINLPLEREHFIWYKENKCRISKRSVTIFCTKNLKKIFVEQHFSKDFSKFLSDFVQKKVHIQIKVTYIQCYKTLTFGEGDYREYLIKFIKDLSYRSEGIPRFELLFAQGEGKQRSRQV